MTSAPVIDSPGVELPAASDLVHLHVHSEYSLLDGAARIGALVARAKALGHSALALTDHGNLFGAIEFFLKCKEAKLKAIIGSEIWHKGQESTAAVAKTLGLAPPRSGAWHLVLLARSMAGYKNLIRVVSEGYLRTLGEVPIVEEDVLDRQGADLIALSGCMKGEFAFLVGALRKAVGPGAPLAFSVMAETQQEIMAAMQHHVDKMTARYGVGNYYVELIDNNLPDQQLLLRDLAAAARYFRLPLVATADAHYLEAKDSYAHTILLAIKHGITLTKLRGRRRGARFHLLDNEDMLRLYQEWPDALANQKKIADLCDLTFKFGQYILPKFESGLDESQEDAVARLSREGLTARLEKIRRHRGDAFTAAHESEYRDRLAYELAVICKMGFAGYFLIVQDFINWAKQHGIPVGPGRGSAAGSLVAYALRITDLDPIPYNLLFERFLNPERISMPDIDVDFCQDRRDEVIRYVTHKYGASNVSQITTFGTMNAKAAVRDVGRVLDLAYGRVDRFARLIPDEIGITLDGAAEKEPRIAEAMTRDESLADLFTQAKALEGLIRHSSVHPAGIVISDGPLIGHVPVYKVQGADSLITQFDMQMSEKVGLIKFDFLGLKTLTVIERCVALVRSEKRPEFDLELMPLDDRAVYRLISDGHSTGVFQLESSGMRQLITKLKPSCFEDMIALVALFRPGPLGSGMVDDFVERKHGRAKVEYPLPQLESILKDTYGIILYQEQVMKIARELASYTLGEADILRKAMGKKDPKVMEKQKSRFMTGAKDNGIDVAKAGEIFDLMAKFAEYGFNKSHSAAYGLIAYQTAYLKTHFADEFMAAIMSCDLDNTKKIVRYVDECRRLRIDVRTPNINRSHLDFVVAAPRTIDFGLAAIKGVGAPSVMPILKARQEQGPFASLEDLARRVDLAHGVGKKTLELFTQVGALDEFGIARPKLFTLLPELMAFSTEHHAAKKAGQRGLFEEEYNDNTSGSLNWDLSSVDRRPGAPDPEWLRKEKALLGVFLSGHPLHFHRADRKAFGKIGTAQLAQAVGKKTAVTAVLAAVSEKLTKNNSRMASLRLEDEDGAIEAVMFQNEIPPEFPPAGTVVVAFGSVDQGFDDRGLRFRLERIVPIETLRREQVQSATVTVRPTGGVSAVKRDYETALERLKAHVTVHRGSKPLSLVIDYGKTQVAIALDAGSGGVDLGDGFVHGLRLLPFEAVDVSYRL